MYYLLTNLLMRCYYILKENKDGLLRIAGLLFSPRHLPICFFNHIRIRFAFLYLPLKFKSIRSSPSGFFVKLQFHFNYNFPYFLSIRGFTENTKRAKTRKKVALSRRNHFHTSHATQANQGKFCLPDKMSIIEEYRNIVSLRNKAV